MDNSDFTSRYRLNSGDRLRLQQLLTREALLTSSSPKSDKDNEAEDEKTQSAPTRWRLIPDNVSLFEWQKECLDIWLKKRKGTVKVATGGGKTMFALAAAQALQKEVPDLRLVIVVPTIPLMNQWCDELKQSNMPDSKIALMGGGKVVPGNPDIRIVICVINSAREYLAELVAKLNWSSKLLLVVDECHRANATQARRIFESNPAFKLGLSATPEPSEGSETELSDEIYNQSPVGKHIGPIIYDFSLRDAMEAGLLTPFEVWHVGLQMENEEQAKYHELSRRISELRKNLERRYRNSKSKKISIIIWCQRNAQNGDNDAAAFIGLSYERKRLLYKAKSRHSLSLKILRDAVQHSDCRVILFHETICCATDIYLAAENEGLPVVLEHSRLKKNLRERNIEAFRKGDAKIIVSAKSLVEGFNVPSADVGIVAASNTSVRQRIQSLGRMLRKKKTGGKAIIFVFYIKGTTDEAIYDKADWENIIGAQRNRYFEYINKGEVDNQDSPTGTIWNDYVNDLFQEVGEPPRRYRPPCWDIAEDDLEFGGEYPGQTTGANLRLDDDGNLKTEEGALIRAEEDEAIDKIRELNPRYRTAALTPCKHLICRVDLALDTNSEWIYLGRATLGDPQNGEKLRVKDHAGRRVIARKERGREPHAKNPEAVFPWLQGIEKEYSTTIYNLYWDQKTEYWVELDGRRHHFVGEPLMFSD